MLKLSIQHWPSHSQPKLNRSHVEMEGKGSTEANTISVKTTISKVCRHMTSIFWEIWFKAFSKQLLITKECTTTKLVPHRASNSTFYILCSHWCLFTFLKSFYYDILILLRCNAHHISKFGLLCYWSARVHKSLMLNLNLVIPQPLLTWVLDVSGLIMLWFPARRGRFRVWALTPEWVQFMWDETTTPVCISTNGIKHTIAVRRRENLERATSGHETGYFNKEEHYFLTMHWRLQVNIH